MYYFTAAVKKPDAVLTPAYLRGFPPKRRPIDEDVREGLECKKFVWEVTPEAWAGLT